MELFFVVISSIGLLVFLGWTFMVFKNKRGEIQPPIIGLGVFLIFFIGALFYYQYQPREAAVTKVAETKQEPKTEEKEKVEEQVKEDSPEVIEEPRIEIVNGPGSTVKGPANPKYVMDVVYDTKTHKVSGSMSVEFTNNLDVNLSNLYFNVWGNANTFLALTKEEANVKVDQIMVNGQTVDYELKGTALHIPKVDIKKSEQAKVEMEFSVLIPETQDRFGWSKTTTSLGNWFPILAVYDDEGWNIDPYYPSGDGFYSLTGEFDVTFTTEKEQVIATTGTEVGEPKINGSLATHRYTAVDVRDFAMELDPSYKIKQAKVGEVTVNVYYKEEHERYSQIMLNAGTESIALFSEKFGQYPWPELDICAMEGWFGGMEYPQLVMISIVPDEGETAGVDSVVAHETGHQWFYGVIGNNQYDEPWLDESFASFAAELYEQNHMEADLSALGDTHLSASLDTFTENKRKGIPNYFMVIYRYGAMTVNDLRKELGDDQFYASMQAYFNEMKFGVATTADFIRMMEETSGRDLSEFFEDHRVYVSDQQ